MPNPATLAYMERQSIDYEQHREQLLQNYKGQYVLFEDGNVLDVDVDFETLVLRAFAQSGPKDVFIQQVGAEDSAPIVRTPFSSKSV